MVIAYYIILAILLLIGWFVNILGLPGLWLMVLAHVGWPSTIAMVLLALAAELAEFLAGAAGSAAAGGRKRGMFGAIAGGILGGIFLTFLIPIPIIGTIVGACAGAFIGAAVLEYSDKDAGHAWRVGIGEAKGRFWGIVSKLGFGFVMFLTSAWTAVPLGRIGATTPVPVTAPAGSATSMPTAATTASTAAEAMKTESSVSSTTLPATAPVVP